MLKVFAQSCMGNDGGPKIKDQAGNMVNPMV